MQPKVNFSELLELEKMVFHVELKLTIVIKSETLQALYQDFLLNLFKLVCSFQDSQ